MKPIIFHKTFEKHYAKRVSRDKKLIKQFGKHFTLFKKGTRDYPLHDHSLTGTMHGIRAFSIANDIRVIYIETDTKITFVDIGTHNQVYK